MRRIKPLLVTLAATAAIAGGGAAIANAATSGTTGSTSATTPHTTTPQGQSHPAPSPGTGGTAHHCPNMGSAPANGASSSAY
jgi:hypothetical protein